MISVKGQSRVVIENVQPVIDAGRYPAKRTIGERVDVSADIFSDGHDHIRAQVRYKLQSSTTWETVPLHAHGNDFWSGSFYTSEKGIYEFYVAAWVDHFETWYDGFVKKANARIDVSLELKEGIEILQKLASEGGTRLSDASTHLAGQYNHAVTYVLSEDFAALVTAFPLITFESTSPVFKVQSEFLKAAFSTWYELFPRSTSTNGKHGTFKDVISLLPRISDMGFDVLYLPPIHPIGKNNRKGKNNSVKAELGEPGSPWAIGSTEGGHKSVHPELGTLDDFKNLINEARKVGIDIAMDIAFQCAPDHPYVKEHPQWFRQRPDGSIQYAENPPKKYQDIYPFNFETHDWENLWLELKSVFVFWIEHGVRVFRVDNPHTKPIPFWEWVIAEINKEYQDIIFLAEAFTKPKVMASLGKSGYTQSYTYFTWRISKQELTDYMNELVHSPSRNYFRPNFWPNTPDILPFNLQRQGETSFIIRYALAATLASSYGIYGPAYEFGDNEAMAGKEEYFNSEKYEVKSHNWNRANKLTQVIKQVNAARKHHPALQSTWNITFCNVENPNLIAYVKATDDLQDVILVVVNLDPNQTQSGFVQLPLWRLKTGERIQLKLHDLITGEQYSWTQEWNYVELNPAKLSFHLFAVKLHESWL